MARAPGDLLQLLANPTNRAILSILALEPQYPRRLAELVGLTEDEASRRLRAFQRLGLAAGEWANLGKTVRLYRLASPRITVQVTPTGLTVSGVAGERPLEVGGVAESMPALQRFVGRAAELERLAALLEARRAVLVHGIGGVGKTSLAAGFARRSGRPVAWHTVAPAESGLLLLARLAANLRALDAGDRAQRLVSLAASDDAKLLLDAVVESANALRALLVADRFEAAGEGAGDVLADIARRLTDARLLVTSRALSKELPRDALAPLPLGGLSEPDAEALLAALGRAVPGEVGRAVYARTRGHPLSLVLVAMAAEGKPGLDAQRLFEEAGIRDFLLHDVLPQLAEAERAALLSLAVLREPFTAEEAEAVADSRHAVNALYRLEARGLVARAGETFAIHDLVRGFAAEAAPERRKVHARAARALRATGQPGKVLEALHHLLEAGQLGDAAALVREECARRTYRFADLGLGAPYREVLLRLSLAAALDAAGRCAVDIELGVLDTLAGEGESAARRLDAAEAALRRGDPLAARLLLARARLHRVRGEGRAASQVYREVERRAEAAGDRPLLLEALLDHGFNEEEISDANALPLYQRAAQIGQETSDMRLLSLAYDGAARVTARNGDPRAIPLSQEALRLARLSGYLRGEAATYMTMVTHFIVSGQMSSAGETVDRYVEIANRLGDPWIKACALVDKSFYLISQGRPEEALATAEPLRALAEQIKSVFYGCSGAIVEAEALLALDRAEEAVARMRPWLERKREYDAWPAMTARAWRCMAAAQRALGHAREGAAAERHAERYAERVRKAAAGAKRLPGLNMSVDMLGAPGVGRQPGNQSETIGAMPGMGRVAVAGAARRKARPRKRAR